MSHFVVERADTWCLRLLQDRCLTNNLPTAVSQVVKCQSFGLILHHPMGACRLWTSRYPSNMWRWCPWGSIAEAGEAQKSKVHHVEVGRFLPLVTQQTHCKKDLIEFTNLSSNQKNTSTSTWTSTSTNKKWQAVFAQKNYVHKHPTSPDLSWFRLFFSCPKTDGTISPNPTPIPGAPNALITTVHVGATISNETLSMGHCLRGPEWFFGSKHS